MPGTIETWHELPLLPHDDGRHVRRAEGVSSALSLARYEAPTLWADGRLVRTVLAETRWPPGGQCNGDKPAADQDRMAAGLGAKEGQHGEDAAIVIRRFGEAELVEDPADIALDGLLAEVEPLADG